MKNKKNLFTALLATSAILASGFTLTGCTGSNPGTDSSIIEDVEISNCKGIKIKYLSTGETSEGYSYKEFSYSVEPASATFTDVTVSVLYVDGTECSSAVEVSVNNLNKTIKLICKQAFGKQIILTVQSELHPEIKATATIDYLKRTQDFSICDAGVHVIGNSPVSSSDECDCGSLFNFQYTLYTKDNGIDYTFHHSVCDVIVTGDLLEGDYQRDYDSEELLDFFYNHSDVLVQELDSNALSLDGISLDATKWVEAAEGNASAELLIEKCIQLYGLNQNSEQPDQGMNSFENYIEFSFDEIEVIDNYGFDKCCPFAVLRLYPAEMDWSEYYTAPTSINLENVAFEF